MQSSDDAADWRALGASPPLYGMLPRDGAIRATLSPQEALVRAVSRLLTIRIAQQGEYPLGVGSTASFRGSHLGGKVLEPQEVEAWVQEQGKQDGAPSYWLSGVPLDPGAIQQDGDAIVLRVPLAALSYGSVSPIPAALDPALVNMAYEHPVLAQRELVYLVPMGDDADEAEEGELDLEHAKRAIPVRSGGTLDGLRRLALAIANNGTSWQAAQASTFVLTGYVPYLSAYAREVLHGGTLVRGRRPRELGMKALELAVFTAEWQGQTLAARMAAWNELHPDWAYSRVTTFGWDSRQALKRLEDRISPGPHGDEGAKSPGQKETRIAR